LWLKQGRKEEREGKEEKRTTERGKKEKKQHGTENLLSAAVRTCGCGEKRRETSKEKKDDMNCERKKVEKEK
jgi:hypothetical protein